VGNESLEVESHTWTRAETGWQITVGVLLTVAAWRVRMPAGPLAVLHPITLAVLVAVIGRYVPWGLRTTIAGTAVLAVVLVITDFRDADRLGHDPSAVAFALANFVICALTAAAWLGGLVVARRRSVRTCDRRASPPT
jgi:hypothetical protein